MSEHDTPCLVCGHYDHFFPDMYDDNDLAFLPMHWDGGKRNWAEKCFCKKYIGSNLEYLEYLYNEKNKKQI